MRLSRLVAAFAAVLSFAHCAGPNPACTTGTTQACVCTDGRHGAQTCAMNGTFGSCVCTGDTDTSVPTDAIADAPTDTSIDNVVPTDTNLPIDAFDSAPADTFVDTGPDLGGVGDPCMRNGDCPTGLCLASGRCSRTCTDAGECPESWTCGPLPGVGDLCQCTPSGTESCDGVDNDCNGFADDGPLCPGNQLCIAGACACPPERMCGGICADITTDRANCGACGNACSADHVCVAGACTCPGVTGVECGGVCHDLASDPDHCGMCGHACAIACNAGSCTSVAQISAGGDHTCVRLTDGTARCWGSNLYGEVGDGTGPMPRLTPAPVIGLAAISEIAAGGQHTCARMNDGTLQCWGVNGNGQLGYGDTSTSRPMPVVVTGLSDVAQVTLGSLHTCARSNDGTVRCWGSNRSGQLGIGTIGGDVASPMVVAGLTSATSVRAGVNHSCALLGDGTVRCWGTNGQGQLGDGTTSDHYAPAMVSGLAAVVQIAAGEGHNCALSMDGSVRCWGYNSQGQLGDGTTMDRTVPTLVTGMPPAVEIAAGGSHTCARAMDGSVRCWGGDFAGQVGDGGGGGGPTLPRTSPILVAGLPPAAQISLGRAHSCARLVDGGVRCWGAPNAGQLGDGTTTNSRPRPVTVQGASSITNISIGGDHTCARSSDGTARCWGNNSWGQIGDGTRLNLRSLPTVVPGLAGVAQVSGGSYFTCARMNDGTVRCWGHGASGELGDGTGLDRLTPTAIPGLSSVAEISCGYDHSCARAMDGTVSCWGNNMNGQLGDGTTTTRRSPIVVPGLTSVVQISAGTRTSCARLMDGTVRCWGNNDVGQAGDGTSGGMRATPTAVVGLANVTSIAAGNRHMCATRSDGTALCWGAGNDGQLGNGAATTSLTTPTAVVGLTSAVEIALGLRHTCARSSDGTVRCWGFDDVGQIGDGTIGTTHLAPTLVSLAPVSGLTAGGSNSCVFLSDGTGRCWGANVMGQTGDYAFTEPQW